jgi:hypothetical protein
MGETKTPIVSERIVILTQCICFVYSVFCGMWNRLIHSMSSVAMVTPFSPCPGSKKLFEIKNPTCPINSFKMMKFFTAIM